jgi:hypothetical protein
VNLVEGNVIVGTQDAGIQLSSGAIIRNNIVVGAAGYGIFLANNQNQQSGVFHDVQIVHNTVYNSGAADLYLRVRSHTTGLLIDSVATIDKTHTFLNFWSSR